MSCFYKYSLFVILCFFIFLSTCTTNGTLSLELNQADKIFSDGLFEEAFQKYEALFLETKDTEAYSSLSF